MIKRAILFVIMSLLMVEVAIADQFFDSYLKPYLEDQPYGYSGQQYQQQQPQPRRRSFEIYDNPWSGSTTLDFGGNDKMDCYKDPWSGAIKCQ